MKSISRAIDRFCEKHRRFGIPHLMKYIVFLNASVFIFSWLDRTGTFFGFLTFNISLILRGQIWRLITWVFIPYYGDLIFTMLALYFYYSIGVSLEREWGTTKFSLFYLLGVICNIIYASAMSISSGLTANYINLSMFFAFAALYPDMQVLLFFIIPLKIKWLAFVNALYFVYDIFTMISYGMYARAFLPLVAVLNFILICGDDLTRFIKFNVTSRTAAPSDFRRASRQAQKDVEEGLYRHKCAVCGKTNVDHPDLDFRYCSRCNGDHCFCMEHINAHVHFK